MMKETNRRSSGSIVYRRHKKTRLYTYVAMAISLMLLCSLPKNIYEYIQQSCISLYCRFSPNQSVTSSAEEVVKELDLVILKERISILENRLQAYEVANHTPPLFSGILSPYFHKLIVSRVVYRDPAHWGSYCWVNVGKEQGIQKNSPVLSGKVLIGLVDYVGEQQSRIRLITDVGMKPSVIAVRGDVQAWLVQDQIRSLSNKIQNLSDEILLERDKFNQLDLLEEMSQMIRQEGENTLLLRGTLSGNGGPLWKEETFILRGEGFCFQKDKGLQVGDILVTTGLDGVFPPGLLVAQITQVCPPKEGACSYKIEAKSLANNLQDLTSVLVLPAMEFNPNDRPDIFGLLWD